MWKEEFGDEVYEVISSFLPVGREIIEYIANAPGIDEEFALSYIYKIYKAGDYDLIVWDTAPAGGTLSLIKLQDKLYRHLGEAARLYIRVRKALDTLTKGRVKRDPLTLIAKWETLAQDVLDMLKDKRTYSIVVTIPEALGVNQTERVVKELESFGVRVGRILVNFVLPDEALTSGFYKKRSEMQRRYIEVLEERFSDGIKVSALPLLPFEVKGLEALRNVASLLF